METQLVKFVKKNVKKNIGPCVGVVVAVKTGPETVHMGWSKCRLTAGDKFDKARGLEIAVNRAVEGSRKTIAETLTHDYDELHDRATKYFKGCLVVA